MRKMHLIAPLLLSACVAPPPGMNEPAGGLCRPGSADRFVGQAATAELGSEMLAASGARQLRWVPHGGIITMEFSPNRLTVRLDQANRVESATCG
jgi:hypothetical protein